MKFTLSWLKDHLDTDATVEALAEWLDAVVRESNASGAWASVTRLARAAAVRGRRLALRARHIAARCHRPLGPGRPRRLPAAHPARQRAGRTAALGRGDRVGRPGAMAAGAVGLVARPAPRGARGEVTGSLAMKTAPRSSPPESSVKRAPGYRAGSIWWKSSARSAAAPSMPAGRRQSQARRATR